MARLLSKLRTAAGILMHSDRPVAALKEQLLRNRRNAFLAINQSWPLIYQHSAGFKFAAFRDIDETLDIYREHDRQASPELSIAREWLSPGDLAIDCGANVGVFAAALADRVGARGRVVAVEASPETFDRLERTLSALQSPQVEALNVCISDADGTVLFGHNASSSVASSIVSEDWAGPSQAVEAISIRALLRRLDDALPALIKLDIEGAEPSALKGAAGLLASSHLPLLIIEVYPAGLRRLGYSPSDIFDRLPLTQYELWHVNFSWPNTRPDVPRYVPLTLGDPYAYEWPLHSNLIAFPRTGSFADRRRKVNHLLASS